MRARRIITIVTLWTASLISAGAEDIVHLNPRGLVRGEITELTDEHVRVKVALGAGSAAVMMKKMIRIQIRTGTLRNIST